MFSIFVLLCQSRVKHCICYCHLVLFVGLFWGHCSNNVAISHLSTASSAISIRSWQVEISFVNGNEVPCATLLPASSNFYHSALCTYLFIPCWQFSSSATHTHTHFFIISTSYIKLTHIWLLRPAVMSSVLTNDYARCQCCNASFQRLSSHLSRNEFCGTYYKNVPLDRGNGGVGDDVHARGVAHFNQAGATMAGTRKSTRIHERASTLGDVVGDNIPVD